MHIQTLGFSCNELRANSDLIISIMSHATSQCDDTIMMP